MLQSSACPLPSLTAATKQEISPSLTISIELTNTEKLGLGLSITLWTIAIPVKRAVSTPVRTSQAFVSINNIFPQKKNAAASTCGDDKESR